MSDPISKTIPLDSREEAVILLGPRDQFLRLIRDTLGVKLFSRGDLLQAEGTAEGVEQTERAFQQLRSILRRSGKLMPEDVRTVLEVIRGGPGTGGLAVMDS